MVINIAGKKERRPYSFHKRNIAIKLMISMIIEAGISKKYVRTQRVAISAVKIGIIQPPYPNKIKPKYVIGRSREKARLNRKSNFFRHLLFSSALPVLFIPDGDNIPPNRGKRQVFLLAREGTSDKITVAFRMGIWVNRNGGDCTNRKKAGLS
jgi:hypothetical protein